MEYQEVITDDSGVTFFPDKPYRYHIMWWQIDSDGYELWINHLSDKNWFSDKIRRIFKNLCIEHKSAVFYN